ncbi:MAG: glycerophosphodiester phosphodiesterase family protein [Burkholderiaceae bacterium]
MRTAQPFPVLIPTSPRSVAASTTCCRRRPGQQLVCFSRFTTWLFAAAIATFTANDAIAADARATGHHNEGTDTSDREWPIQLGPRPFFLVKDMDESPLKDKLQSCRKGPFYKSDFSIGHRGAPLQFPEHTEQSYRAAARMGAGIMECDVTFTQDRELVCRHSQCDLHTTTNILDTPLAAKCSKPFTPADPVTGTKASARCCTSDITLAEFKTLEGKMDAANKDATSVQEYMGGTADFRTDLYATRGTLLSHKESIALFKSLGVKMTPELKAPAVEMPFQGQYTQQQYAQQLIDELRAQQVSARDVWAQSFNLDDVKYWLSDEPEFGRQAVYLDGRYRASPPINSNDPASFNPSMQALADAGVQVIAPPIYMLLTLDEAGKIIPSAYAKSALEAGLDIIAWTLERSGPLTLGGGFYYQTVKGAINNDGDMLTALHVLSEDIGVLGVFSDWPATTTYYANCMKRY